MPAYYLQIGSARAPRSRDTITNIEVSLTPTPEPSGVLFSRPLSRSSLFVFPIAARESSFFYYYYLEYTLAGFSIMPPVIFKFLNCRVCCCQSAIRKTLVWHFVFFTTAGVRGSLRSAAGQIGATPGGSPSSGSLCLERYRKSSTQLCDYTSRFLFFPW